MDFYPVGFRIADRYEVIQPPNLERGIRVGSIGFVYICRDTEKNQLVALKFFKPDHLYDLAARARFMEEGNAWVQLGVHPHIVHCYTVRHMDPTVFLVLELIANVEYPDEASLDAWMGAPMPVDQALLFALQIARGMKYAVGKLPGLVHCDLKPGNVLVNADTLPGTNINRLCVSDFGLLKIVTEGDADTSKPNRDRSNRSPGTPEYMAPEQWKNGPVGVYTDVYALGGIFYDMLTGRPVRIESNPNEVRAAHINGTLRPMSQEIPEMVRAFLKRSLSLNSADRYQTWNEVTVALEELYSSLGVGPIPHAGEEEVDAERFALASSFNAMGIHCAHMGKTQDAIEYFEKALAIFKEIDHRQGEGAVLGNLGNTYSRLGRMDNALSYCEQDLAIAREREDRLRESVALGSIGEIYRNQGDARSAIGFQEQRLKIVREIGDHRGEGNTWSSLGMAYADLGDVTRALKYYKKQLVITRRIGDRRGRCNAWGNLGNAHSQLGETNRAIRFYNLYSETAKKIGDWVGAGTALSNLGNVYLAQGYIQPAIDLFFNPSLAIARDVADRRGEGIALGNLGIAYAQLGETSRAFDYCKKRLKIAIEIDDNDGLCSALFNMGLFYMQKGEVQDAILIWVNLYVFAREMNLDKALHRLEKLASRVGLPDGLDGWERLVKTMQKQGTIKDFLKDLMKK